jgi:hypothetical protein
MDKLESNGSNQIQHVALSNLTASLQDHRGFVVICVPAHV